MNSTHLLPLASLLLLTASSAIASDSGAPSPLRDIVSTARAAGSFRTLEAALDAAGLVDTLRGPGPFTVFAPTDDAFAKLPADSLRSLLAPQARERLRGLLLHHVVSGRVLAKDLLPSSSATSVGGTRLDLSLVVGDARVVTADVLCANGVIHVIDRVLTPPAASAPRPDVSVARRLEAAIEVGAPLFNSGDVTGCVRAYEAAAAELLGSAAGVLAEAARDDLARAVATPASDARARAWDLRHVFDRILADEAFTPRIEAALPEGFPAPGPVGRVVLKRYPAYRAARAQGGGSFFTLFRHIQRNDVEMTAPVEMTLGEDRRAKDMAFLYGTPRLGRAGVEGDVSVVDLPAVTVMSIGLRGSTDSDAVGRARDRVQTALSSAGWREAGPWRLLGYNSPMVPEGSRFSEVQVPVTR